jgi:exopolyphosphatase / guanosine-5'-triphosphate,3'-diphosphate pyrophosphatase
VSYRRHHRHSQELIMHADRLNLTPRDRLLVALISRYHRRSGPRKTDAEYAALPREDREIVRRLSALLRVADGLDRGHTAIVESLSATMTPDRVEISVVPRFADADLSLECWGGSRKADVLAKLTKREVGIRAGVVG